MSVHTIPLVRAALVLSYMALVIVTVVAFLVIDVSSHSPSDTLRPFLITMVPLWVIAIGLTRVTRRARPPSAR